MVEKAGFRFPGGMNADRFLEAVWQRRPLVCPQALRATSWAPEPDDLFGLAMEDGVDARLVTRRRDRYALETGPFESGRFDRLPERDWTLLVQAVEVWEPRYHGLLDLFSFLPRWRLDDVMISLAAAGGGVGPHVDQYDVFLVQAAGERRWRYGGPPSPLVAGAPLRQLSRFAPDSEFVAAPGDVLYLPPGVPHDGVAQGDGCITISVGFRAPGAVDLAERLAEVLGRQWAGDSEREPRFGDAGRVGAKADPWLLAPADIARAQVLMSRMLAAPGTLARCLGEQVTQPRMPPAPRRAPRVSTLLARLDSGGHLERWSGSRLAWTPLGRRRALLFADGETYSCSRSLARWLVRRERIAGPDLDRWRGDAAALAILRALVAQGTFGLVGRRG